MEKLKILVCASAKLENRYIEEWVKHYQKLGFDKVVLFDNNDMGSEKLVDVPYVKKLVDDGYIDMYYHPNVRGMQSSQYTECYNIYSNEYDWIAFFDIDEYMEMTQFTDIHDYLVQDKFEGFDAVQILWKIYDDNNIIEVQNNDYSIQNRFTHEFPQPKKSIEALGKQHKYWLKKTIVRGKLHKPVVFWGPDVHTPCPMGTFKDFKACDSAGNETTPWYYFPNNIENLEAWLNHYITKSLQEFVETKLSRLGGAYNEVLESDRINLYLYFTYNSLTYEKIQWLKKRCPELLTDLLNKINKNIRDNVR